LITLAKNLSNKEKVLDGLIARGISEWYLSKWDCAIASYQTAIRLAHEIGNKKKEARAYNGLGNTMARRGLANHKFEDIEQGIGLLQHALQIAEQTNDAEEIWRALSNTGIAYQCYETPEGHAKGAEYHHRALEVAQKLGLREQARSLLGLGSALVQSNQISEGLTALESAVPTLQKVYDKQGLVDAYIDLGAGFSLAGDKIKSRDYFALAEQLAQKIGYKVDSIQKERKKYLKN